MIKKLLTLWICLIVGATGLIKAQNVNFYLEDKTVASGNNVTVDITVDNFTKMNTFEYVIEWDSTVLEYVSHQDINGDINDDSNFFFNPRPFNLSGFLKAIWTGKGNSYMLPDGTVIFSITFKAIGSNGSESPLNFTIGPPPFLEWTIVQDFEEFDDMQIEESTHSGLVTIEGGGGGEKSVTLIGSDENVMSGDVACVDVSVRDFEKVKSMDVFMRYDENVIEFKEVKNFNIPQLSQGNFTSPNPGEVRLSYNYPQGATVDDNTTIYQVCYDAVGSNGEQSAFEFTGGNPNPPLEVINTDNESLDVMTQDGSVSIGGGTGGELFIDIEDYKIGGSQICVPIRVSGYQDIVAFGFSVQFDPNYMTYTGYENFGFSESTFNDNVTQNNIGFVWSAPNPNQPESLSDNSVLVELCFTLEGNCGEGTTLTFSDADPENTLYEAPNVEIFPDYRNGDLSCEGKSVEANVENVSCGGNCDGEISLDISGWDVETIEWSDSDLPGEATVTGLCEGLYSVTVTYTDGQTVTEPDIEVGTDTGPTISINEIRADLGNSEGAIDINASGSSNLYEWSNGEETEDISGLDAGTYSVTVTSENKCSTVLEGIVVLSVEAQVTDASCGNAQDGEINTSVSGGSGNYSYAWSCSSSSEASITDVPAGECILTITDEDGDFDNIATFTVNSPTPIELTDVETTADSGGGNGSVDITVGGGEPPYSYEWLPTGDTTEDLSGIENGSYIIVITDSNGCVFRSQPIDVGEGGPIVVVSTSADVYNGFGVSCSGECNGYINIETYNLDDVEIEWDDGSTSFSRDNLCSGDYAYTLTSEGNEVENEIVMLKEPDEFTITNIDTDCASGNSGSASINVSGGVAPYLYSWDGITYDEKNDASGLSGGDYKIFVRDDNGCELMQEYTINECEDFDADCFDGRKVITPNGDNRNDELIVKMCGEIETNTMKIYTQWGELVYEEDNYSNAWEGVSNTGDRLDDGLYFWVLRLTLNTGETQTHKGSVNLVRTMN